MGSPVLTSSIDFVVAAYVAVARETLAPIEWRFHFKEITDAK
jgi:hypothetical protein